jgi:alcohol dehydrogenase, propanol-preferring
MCRPALRRGCRAADLRRHHHLQGNQETGRSRANGSPSPGPAASGILAIQYAKAMGLLVCAIDIDDGKLAHAKRLGADLVINAKAGDPAAA